VVGEVHRRPDGRSLGERSYHDRPLFRRLLFAPTLHGTVEAHPHGFPGRLSGGDDGFSTDQSVCVSLGQFDDLAALVVSYEVRPDVTSTCTGIQA
jgi:hypothetical protein